MNDTTVIDLREIFPLDRHPLVFQTFDQLQPGAALILVIDHDPMPLYYQFTTKRAYAFRWKYLEQGPKVWRVRICKI
jgi:uncharacterized protein (DUF2249 family)